MSLSNILEVCDIKLIVLKSPQSLALFFFGSGIKTAVKKSSGIIPVL